VCLIQRGRTKGAIVQHRYIYICDLVREMLADSPAAAPVQPIPIVVTAACMATAKRWGATTRRTKPSCATGTEPVHKTGKVGITERDKSTD